MSNFERGQLRSYEIQWTSGHAEIIQAHQVSWPSAGGSFFGPADDGPQFIRFMGEIDGRWTLILQCREDDIRTVRDVTTAEAAPGGGS